MKKHDAAAFTPTNMMTTRDVRMRVAAIKAKAADAEAAHALEDELFFDVLNAVARGACESPKDCARIALQTKLLEFDRWTA